MQKRKYQADDKGEKRRRIQFESESNLDYAYRMFLKTYNTNYLSNLTYQEILNMKTSLNNSVLEKLINNYLKPKLEKPYLNMRYIEGPNKMYVYELEHPDANRMIYLFGEYHQDTGKHCNNYNNSLKTMTFTEFISDMLDNSQSFFDLYVELNIITSEKKSVVVPPLPNGNILNIDELFNIVVSPYIIGKPLLDFEEVRKEFVTKISSYGVSNSSTLNDMFENLNICINPATRNVEDCNLMRIHSIDARNNYQFENKLNVLKHIFVYFFDKLENQSEFYTKLLRAFYDIVSSSKTYILMEMFTGMFSDFDIDDQVIFLYDILINTRWIEKQYRNSYYQIPISDFIKLELKSILEEYPIIFDAIRYINSKKRNYDQTQFDSEMIDSFQICSEFFHRYDIIQMDFYALCRIFKNFTPRLTENREEPLQSYNIIIYCGGEHIEMYKNFLEHIKNYGYEYNQTRRFENPYKITLEDGLQVEKGCVDMKTPIFNHREPIGFGDSGLELLDTGEVLGPGGFGGSGLELLDTGEVSFLDLPDIDF